VIRVPGEGLVVQKHRKSNAGTRTITPPARVMELLVRRYSTSAGPWVFPSTSGKVRDPDNTRNEAHRRTAGRKYCLAPERGILRPRRPGPRRPG
jgi:hypothetical protein